MPGELPKWLRKDVEKARLIPRTKTAVDYFEPGRKVHLLQLNESPYPPSPKAIEAATAALQIANRYCDGSGLQLRQILSAQTGIDVDAIIVSCGSEELIRIVIDVLALEGGNIVIPFPTFPFYEVNARLRGLEVRHCALRDDGSNDIDRLLAAVDNQTRALFICTPNAPTGAGLPAEELDRLISDSPDDLLLVIDEAYFEYSRHVGGADVLKALQARKGPWLSLRTFSKAYGLAGMRIGYALCSSVELANQLQKLKLVYGANAPSQAAAIASLLDTDYTQATLSKIEAERQALSDGLSALGFRVYESVTNFVSIDFGQDAAAAIQYLADRDIYVRDWRSVGYESCMRITVGTAEDTDAVLSALRSYIE